MSENATVSATNVGSAEPRLAVIGCGAWGQNHVRVLSELGLLCGLADADAAAARRVAGQYGVPCRATPELFADPNVDGVVIAAPAAAHYSLARAALMAGKHCLVEKPLALEIRQGEELSNLARGRGRVLMVGHLLHYHGAFVRLKGLVRAGELGKLQYIYSNRLNFGRIRREENILWSFAPHDVSMILALVGEEPEFVRATGSHYLRSDIADVTLTEIKFASGVNAHIFVSWLHPFKEQKLVVVGDRGMATFDDSLPWDRKLLLYPHRVDWREGQPTPSKGEGQAQPLAPMEPLREELCAFASAIVRGTPVVTDGTEGVRVLRILHAAERSMRAGNEPFQQGLEKSRFPGVFVHESTYIDDNVEIGEGSKIWHFSHILQRTRLGKRVVVGQNGCIGPDVTIGDNCKIQNNVSIYKGVILEDGVFCGPSCVFTNVLTPRADVERKDEFRATLVRSGATIGANATIVCGVTIGAYSMIGAGAVVTRDVPDYALMAGVPARRIGWVSASGERLNADLLCPRTGQRYRQVGDDTLVLVMDTVNAAQ